MCIFFFNRCVCRYRNTITKYQSLLINLFLIDASVTIVTLIGFRPIIVNNWRYTNEFFVSLDRMTTPNTVPFLISQGKKMLNINNFIFKLSKTTSTKKYYQCEDLHCTVTVHTDLEDIILNIKDVHCHPPECCC